MPKPRPVSGLANHGIARALVGVLLVLALLFIASSSWGLINRGSLGFTADADGKIVSVAPATDASRAGLHPGDRIVADQTPIATRVLSFGGMYVAGTTLSYAVKREGAARIVPVVVDPVTIQSDPLSFAISFAKRPVAALLCLLAGVLVLLRPQRATWALLCYSLLNTVYTCNQYWPFPWQAGWIVASAAAQPLIGAALLYFAVAFLHDDSRPWHRAAVSVATIGSVLFSLWLVVANLQAAFGSGAVGLNGLDAVGTVWIVVETLVTIAILVETYLTGRRVRRQRIAWVVVGIAFAVVFQLLVPSFVGEDTAAVAHSAVSWTAYLMSIVSPLAVCSAVVYAMTQYRVVDLRFTLNRALVYTATTTLLVALFALVEWATSRIFESSRIEVVASILAALLVGFTLNAFHKRIDDLVDVLFFRRERHSAERLKHLAASLQYADDEGTVGRFIVEEPMQLLDLASAALFVCQENGSFRLGGNSGWDGHASATIERTDPLIPQLRAATAPLWLKDFDWHPSGVPTGAAEPLYALPIKARADLFGIVFYGGHSNGATLNVDERALLATLVSSAASAFDHIEASNARAEMRRLVVEVEVLTRLRASV
jgi:hypothetical protein